MAALTALSYIETLSGAPASATEHLLQALRVGPRDPLRPTVLLNLAMASGCARRYADGIAYAILGIRQPTPSNVRTKQPSVPNGRSAGEGYLRCHDQHRVKDPKILVLRDEPFL